MPTTDLPAAIRDALHANEITAADLRQLALRDRPRPRRGPRTAAAALTAAAVVGLAVGVAAVAGHDGSTPANPPAGVTTSAGVSSIVGYRWAVTQVRDAQGTVAVPAGSGAYVGFSRDGYVFGDDTLNVQQGNYALTDTGYHVDNVAGSAVGMGPGGDPDAIRIISGIDAVFVPSPTDPAPLAVAVRIDGEALTLSHGDVTLTLRQAGTQSDFGH